MARPLQFHWANTPHVLSISGTDFGVYGQLDVVKPNDTQHLLFLIEGATVAEFEAAWERQRGNWLELFRSPEGETVFRALPSPILEQRQKVSHMVCHHSG